MIWPLLLLILTPARAQIDFSAIRELDESLPNYNDYKQSDEEANFSRRNRQYEKPNKIIPFETIKNSGTQMGAIPKGARLKNIENNKTYTLSKLIYVRYFNFEDENGLKYIQDKDGAVRWRIQGHFVVPIKEELSLYEKPLRYTPAPYYIARAQYDKKLNIVPQVSFYAGIVSGNYMADLLNDNKAQSGLSNQYGLNVFTQWNLPIKIGAVLHYERASYPLDNGGQVLYSSPSFGPQFRTKDFEFQGHPLRFQTQFRFSPLSSANVESVRGPMVFKFNSADLLASLERPIKNQLGEFILGLYFQSQWLNLREQDQLVDIQASNATNSSFGLVFAQVFE